MRPMSRFLPLACLASVAAVLAACAGGPMMSSGGTPSGVVGANAPMPLEFGRVTSIEYVPAGAAACAEAPRVKLARPAAARAPALAESR